LIFYNQHFTDIILTLGSARPTNGKIVLKRQTIGRPYQDFKKCQ